MTLKAGHLVYRVIKHDPPGAGPHTWKVASVVVKQASAKQIKLKGLFPDLWRTTFEPDALGCSFFPTPLRAVQAFLAAQKSEIKTLERRRMDADRAIAWARNEEDAVRLPGELP